MGEKRWTSRDKEGVAQKECAALNKKGGPFSRVFWSFKGKAPPESYTIRKIRKTPTDRDFTIWTWKFRIVGTGGGVPDEGGGVLMCS